MLLEGGNTNDADLGQSNTSGLLRFSTMGGGVVAATSDSVGGSVGGGAAADSGSGCSSGGVQGGARGAAGGKCVSLSEEREVSAVLHVEAERFEEFLFTTLARS